MGFTEFKNDLLLKAYQNKPEIMLVAGLIGVVGFKITNLSSYFASPFTNSTISLYNISFYLVHHIIIKIF